MKIILLLMTLTYSLTTYADVIGSACMSDTQCDSLCCNFAMGSCMPHDPNLSPPVFCSKDYYQRCISDEFCKFDLAPKCILYKNGQNSDGNFSCYVKCSLELSHGTCGSWGGEKYCLPSKGDTDISKFDLKTCNGAIDPQ